MVTTVQLGALDLAILGVFAIAMAVGFHQGVIRQLFLLGAIYFGMVIAAQYYLVAASALALLLPGGEPRAYSTVGLILVFVVATLAVNAVGYVTYTSTRLSTFASADRMSGAVLGVLSGWLFISLLLVVADFGLTAQLEGLQMVQGSALQLMHESTLAQAMHRSMPAVYETLRPWIPSGLPAPFAA